MIIIDWLSFESHASFNANLFAALGLEKVAFYVFSRDLFVNGQLNIFLECSANRFRRALSVFRICWNNRSNSIFLLTYDPLFAPLLRLYCRHLYVYEHNTTPERSGLNKHAVWQKLFCRSLIRMAQFPNQMEVLRAIGQRCFYVGSPLSEKKIDSSGVKPTVYLAPSWRFQAGELLKIKSILGQREVVIKRGSISDAELEAMRRELNIAPIDWIDLEEIMPRAIAIVVTISSATRGTGWFNEAIRYGVPLIIVNRAVQEIFRSTFPLYPFIDPTAVTSQEDLDSQLQAIRRFPRDEYVERYNKKLRDRFVSLLSAEK